METEKTKPTLDVVVDVKAINYQNGNVYEAEGKLKTVFGGRGQIAEESLTFRGTDCGKSQMEVDYNSASTGIGEKTTNVELDIKGRVLNERKELIDVVAANAKLAKTDTGIDGVKAEDWLKLKLENGCDAKCATTDSYYTHKTSEVIA